MLKKIFSHFVGRMCDQGGWIGAAIAGGAMLLGGYLANRQSAENTSDANAQSAANTAAANRANQQTAREQMKFQERMSNSAYQRAMTDMKRAGLNPILAYQQGGASSPAGASYNAQAANVSTPNYQDPLSPAVSGAVDAYSKTEQLKVANEQVRLAGMGIGIQQANSTADIALKAAQAAATASSAKKTETESKILESRAKREKLEGDWYSSDHGKTMFQLNKINEAAGGALNSMNSAKELLNPLSFMRSLQIYKGTKKKGFGTTKDGTDINLGTGEIVP